MWSWRDVLVVKSPHYSCKGPGLLWDSQLSLTTVPGLSSGLHCHMHACGILNPQNINIYIIENIAFYYFVYMAVLPASVSVYRIHAVSLEDRREPRIPWDWS